MVPKQNVSGFRTCMCECSGPKVLGALAHVFRKLSGLAGDSSDGGKAYVEEKTKVSSVKSRRVSVKGI